MAAARVVGGQDLVEEFLAVKVWPLTSGWLLDSFSKVKVDGLRDSLPFPSFGLAKPEGVFDDLIVDEIEQQVMVLVGPYNSKECDSFVDCCPDQLQVNRSFVEMKVQYGEKGKRLWSFGFVYKE